MADKDTTLLIDNFYPTVEKNLSNRANLNLLIKYIDKYVDANSSILFTAYPTQQLYFGRDPRDIDVLFEATGLRENDIVEFIKNFPVPAVTSWKILGLGAESNVNRLIAPARWVFALILRYLQLKKMNKELYKVVMYFTLSLYSSIYYKYFEYGVQENIMIYTINQLSNKFKIKQTGSLFKTLEETAIRSHKNYIRNLEKGSDVLIIEYIHGLYTRINSLVKNISREYYKVRDQGLYLNVDEESADEENYREIDNASLLITRISDHLTLRLATHGVDRSIASMSAKWSGVSVRAIEEAMEKIVETEGESIREMFTLILEVYLIEDKNDPRSIASRRFISECLKTYSKSNIRSKSVLRMRELLDEWLERNSERYVRTERVATKINFRKAIYTYFVLAIHQAYSRG